MTIVRGGLSTMWQGAALHGRAPHRAGDMRGALPGMSVGGYRCRRRGDALVSARPARRSPRGRADPRCLTTGDGRQEEGDLHSGYSLACAMPKKFLSVRHSMVVGVTMGAPGGVRSSGGRGVCLVSCEEDGVQ
jgi:hypothetical protein